MKDLSLYIHVPFCSRKCHYCDFYSINSLQNHSLYTQATCMSIKNIIDTGKQDYLVKTIYFGGGTPNFLPLTDLEIIMKTINENFNIDPKAEMTIEINPEFAKEASRLNEIKNLGFNRLSIGIQSFNDNELKILGRIHDSKTAQKCIEDAKGIFDNLSLDLIYAIPGQTLESLENNLNKMISYAPQHISCYNLTREEGTELAKRFDSGMLLPAEEDLEILMFKLIHHKLIEAGYEHYEVSNYAQPGYRSKHNSSYWTDQDYLGIGPSAHSRIGDKRYAFYADLNEFIKQPSAFHKQDMVTETDTLITRLRCSEGLNKADVSSNTWDKVLVYANQNPNWFIIENNFIKCTLQGWLMLDTILVDLI